jgi:hypothetical protein
MNNFINRIDRYSLIKISIVLILASIGIVLTINKSNNITTKDKTITEIEYKIELYEGGFKEPIRTWYSEKEPRGVEYIWFTEKGTNIKYQIFGSTLVISKITKFTEIEKDETK